jgi:hypothetical protein
METTQGANMAKQIKNILCQGAETKESVEILFGLARLTSQNVKDSLLYHLVTGAADYYCCMAHGIEPSNFSRDLKKLNKVAGEIDKYLDLNYGKYKSRR